ncbi:MAG: Phosphatidate cytidylyltransferase [Micavibrio sp.]|nr:Phosphatidate cytidylyltransferase [Micavibrio sp.]
MGVAKSSSLNHRILSALVLAPVTMVLIYLGGYPYIAMIVVCAVLILREWIRMAGKGRHMMRDSVIGILYVLISGAALIDLRLRHDDTGLFLVVALLLVVWASDTGAYIFGKTIGGPKMCPSISPNKTWAGFAGAMVFPAATLAVLVAAVHMPVNAIIAAFMAGALFGVVGQAGDLLISMFKRRVGVKDTGTLIPGHGGLLDRADSLMLVAPVFLLAYLLWI